MAATAVDRDGEVRVQRFDLPLMEGLVVTEVGNISTVTAPTVQSLEALHKEAYDEGFALGRAQGLEQGANEINEQVQRFAGLAASLARPFEILDEEVVDAVADLAILVARHLVRRELKIAPGEIVAVVRDTMQHLPVAARNPRLRMHPEDIELVENALVIGEESQSWRMQPDPLMTRGGCIVETDASRIDASVEARLAAIVSKMFGGERESDRAD
jgi:flagellar assembly protein FliH